MNAELLKRLKITMDDWRVIGVKEDHASRNLASDADPCGPWDLLIRLMKQIEQSGLR